MNKIYEKELSKVHALRGVSLEVEKGEFIVILGPSGCGKTTLLNIISGILLPTSGEVEVLGERLDKLSVSKRADFRLRNIGYVFQDFNLLPDLTVYENIALPIIASKKKPEEERILELLKLVGLKKEYEGRYPEELSGGEQQRVAIARALANDPKIVLADEPTSNLDTETGKKIVSLLYSICKEGEKTMVVTTHDPEIIEKADRVLKMRDGKFLEAL